MYVEVILGTDDETSSKDDTSLNDEIYLSKDLINYLSACDVEWQLPKNTQEEPPKPHYDPIKTEVEEPLQLVIVYPHSHVASSVMGTNTTGKAHYGLRSLGPLKEEMVHVKKLYNMVKVTNIVLGLKASNSMFEWNETTTNAEIQVSVVGLTYYWVKTINGDVRLQALVDGKKIIVNEASIRRDLRLDDAEGTSCLPNDTIFEELTRMGMMKNLEKETKFLMYPRFVQVFVNQQLGDMSNHKRIFVNPSHTKNVFGNMKREGKGFSGAVTPLFETMMVEAHKDMVEARRIESSKDEDLGDQKDAYKQERIIADIDVEEGVTLVDETQERNDQDMFDTGILDDDEVVAEKEVSTADPVTTAGEVVTTANFEVSATTTAVTIPTISKDELTLAQTLIKIKAAKPKNMVYYLLVEKMYPFTKHTLQKLWNDVRLQVDYKVEMAYDLLRLIRKQLREGYNGSINLYVAHKKQNLGRYYYKNMEWEEDDVGLRCSSSTPFSIRVKTKIRKRKKTSVIHDEGDDKNKSLVTGGRKGKEKVIEDEGICRKGNKTDVSIYKRAMVNGKAKMVKDVGAMKRGKERGVIIEDGGFSNNGGKETVVTKRAIGSRKIKGKSVKVESE
uniref:Uncharacterized protein n=1 Tax=Tanacetum cinerariifolium TaxID=118510 RepID=A0A6L2KBU7_TANCI|nr:hypothetical protein [Tanacetum cinerariifolium]